jgi:predicted metal-binding protein
MHLKNKHIKSPESLTAVCPVDSIAAGYKSERRGILMSVLEDAKPSSNLKPGSSTIVSVCTTCRMTSAESPRVGELVLAALDPVMRDGASGVAVRSVQCLGVCRRPATIAVSAPNGYTFVFGDLDPLTGPAAVAAFVTSYHETDYGFVPWAARPELLRSRLVARIPSTLWSPQDGRPPA